MHRRRGCTSANSPTTAIARRRRGDRCDIRVVAISRCSSLTRSARTSMFTALNRDRGKWRHVHARSRARPTVRHSRAGITLTMCDAVRAGTLSRPARATLCRAATLTGRVVLTKGSPTPVGPLYAFSCQYRDRSSRRECLWGLAWISGWNWLRLCVPPDGQLCRDQLDARRKYKTQLLNMP
jgi:hypothetical protein